MKFDNVIIHDGQSIWDVCVRYYGSMSSISMLLADNNLALNASLTSGQALKIRSNLRTRDRNAVREFFDQSTFTINNHDGSLADTSNPVQPTKYFRPLIKPSLNVTDTWTVQDGQSLYDIAVQWYGTVDGVDTLIIDNGLTRNQTVKSGDVLKLRRELIRLRRDQNVINNNDNFDQISGELRIVLIDIGNETESHLGWITIDVLGGDMPYTYEWKNEDDDMIATTQNLFGIPSGTYTITVTDSVGTTVSLTITVNSSITYNYLIDQNSEIIIDEFGDGILV